MLTLKCQKKNNNIYIFRVKFANLPTLPKVGERNSNRSLSFSLSRSRLRDLSAFPRSKPRTDFQLFGARLWEQRKRKIPSADFPIGVSILSREWTNSHNHTNKKKRLLTSELVSEWVRERENAMLRGKKWEWERERKGICARANCERLLWEGKSRKITKKSVENCNKNEEKSAAVEWGERREKCWRAERIKFALLLQRRVFCFWKWVPPKGLCCVWLENEFFFCPFDASKNEKKSTCGKERQQGKAASLGEVFWDDFKNRIIFLRRGWVFARWTARMAFHTPEKVHFLVHEGKFSRVWRIGMITRGFKVARKKRRPLLVWGTTTVVNQWSAGLRQSCGA